MKSCRCAIALLAASLTTAAIAFDIDIKGKTLEKTLAEISKLADADLRVVPEAANECVFIRAKGTSLQEVMPKLAEATGLEWIKGTRDGKTSYTLTLTTHARVQLQNDYRELVSPYLAHAVQDFVKSKIGVSISNPRALYEAMKTDEASISFGPQDVISLFLDLRLQEAMVTPQALQLLSMCEDGTATAFSSAPLPGQNRLPSTTTNKIMKALAESRSLVGEASKQSPDDSNLKEWDKFWQSHPVTVVKVLIKRSSDYLFCYLYLYDKDRNLLDGSVSTDFTSIKLAIPAKYETSWPDLEPTTDPILEQVAHGIKGLYGLANFDEQSFKERRSKDTISSDPQIPFSEYCSPEARSVFLHPESFDPVGMVAAPYIDKLFPESDFVAVVPDSISAGLASGLLVHDRSRLIPIRNETMRTQSGGWQILRPADRLDAIASCVNRQAFGKLLRAMAGHYGLMGIDDKVAYVVASPPALRIDSFDAAIVSWVFYGFPIIERGDSDPFLRALAAYDPNRPMNRFSDQPAFAAAILKAIKSQVIQDPANLTAYNTGPDSDSNTLTSTLKPDISDVVASGFPNGTTFEVKSESSADTVLALDLNAMRATSMNSYYYAALQDRSLNGGADSYPTSIGAFSQFVPLTNEDFVIDITCPNGTSSSQSANGFKISGSPTSFSGLPDAFKTAVARNLKDIEKLKKKEEKRSGGGGDPVVPPTP